MVSKNFIITHDKDVGNKLKKLGYDTDIDSLEFITLDLNGHKIDRNLTKSIKGGSVIIVERTPLKIIDSSGTNNGLITGGNTTEDGGGIKVCGWASLTVENCKIANNKAQGRGGGVSLYKRYLCTNMGNSSC